MANTHKALKQWCLTKVETELICELLSEPCLHVIFGHWVCSLSSWQRVLGKEDKGFTIQRFYRWWRRCSRGAMRQTRQQKVSMLELMLGQITNYCPVISQNTIVKNPTCIDHIWQTIRLHYGFQSTGAHLIDFAAIKPESNEGAVDLYQRLMVFVEDNL